MLSDLFLTLGIMGMICILVAFLMVQMHKWTQDQFKYDVLNLIGSSLLLAYALDGRAWPFVVLNAVWALYSLRDTVRDAARVRARCCTPSR